MTAARRRTVDSLRRYLDGRGHPGSPAARQPAVDDTFLLVLHPGDRPGRVALGGALELVARSVVLLQVSR